MNDLVITLIGAVVGAVISFLLPVMWRAIQNREHLDLLGAWKSAYTYEDTGEHVVEDVKITRLGSRINIKSTKNPIGDFYEATVTHSAGELSGHWRSNQGQAKGNVILAVGANGAVLYGYFSGVRETGERVFGPWIFGRTEENLKTGAQLLRTQTLPLRE